MAPLPQRQDERRKRPRNSRRGRQMRANGPTRVQFTMEVSREIEAELTRAGKTPASEVAQVLQALLKKLTPHGRPEDKGSLPAEVRYFENLLHTRMEALGLDEQLFVVVNTCLEGLLGTTAEGSEEIRQEVAQAVADLVEWVNAAQQIVRRTRGMNEFAEEAT